MALLAGCAGGGGYRDAPRLADPRLDVPLALSAATPPVAAGPMSATVQAAPQDVPLDPSPQASGPRATSGTVRYDAVGYADNDGTAFGGGITIAHVSLPVGSFVEVTALDSGRTIIAEVADRLSASGMRIAALSPATAAALGNTGGRVAVRVRLTVPSPQDQRAVRSGSVVPRADAPQVLLVALRKRLAPIDVAVAVSQPTPTRHVAPSYTAPPSRPARALAQISRGGAYFVQIAALSDAAKARALAVHHTARVVPGGGFYRVQIGPYADQKMAQQARDGAARRGYGDARIVKAN